MDTKESILDMALGLFNRQGTAAVSTNHIAQGMGISPGNLYYHYHNKEEIIHALFERLFAEWDAAFELDTQRVPTLDDLQTMVRVNFQILWKYRFAYRELVALLGQDAQLKQRWLEVRARGFAGFRALFGVYVEAGVLARPNDPAEIDQMAELCWLISEFWPSYLEVSGREIDTDSLEYGISLMLRAMGFGYNQDVQTSQ